MVLEDPNKWRFDGKGRSIAYFSANSPTIVDRDLVEELKTISKERGNVNARLCLHKNPDETLHSMVIIEYKDNKCKRPHKHLKTGEFLSVIEGKMLSLMLC